MDRKGNLFLFLTEICNIHDLYVSMDHILVRRFLQNFVDKLQVLTKRSVVIGKFKSGGFGLAVESMPSDEAIAVTKKAASLLEGGVAVIDGYEVRYEAKFGSVFYPDDAPDLRRLWKSAQDRLSGKESA
jgi:predicted signal transduction protein with EAL and GGDEF domain